MKILCFIDSLGAGGAQRQLIELAKGFKKNNYEVIFLTYHPLNFFENELKNNKIELFTIQESNYLLRIFKVRKFINNWNADVVISFLQGPSFIATVAGLPFRKWKLIVGERSANPKMLTSLKMKIYRYFHFFTDYVVANSQANLNLVKKINPYLNNDKLKVIYNMVNTPEEGLNLSYNREKIKVVVAASVRPVKNIEGVILAVSKLPLEYKNKLQIDWYGSVEDEKYAENIKNLISKNNLSNTFNLLPPTKIIYDKFIDADFVGLFSHYEGFPNAICEAMSLNAPVIVTNISDIPFFIKNGINGYICESKDLISIQNVLIEAIKSKPETRGEMGRLNKIVSKNNFSKEKILNQYIELIEK